jgi:hypothetical protein
VVEVGDVGFAWLLEVVDRRASATILGVRRLGGYAGWSGVGQGGTSGYGNKQNPDI